MSEGTQAAAARGPRISVADLQLSAAALVAGSGWLFSMHALEALPPLFFMGSRFLMAGLLIGLFADFGSLGRAWRKGLPLAVSAGAMALSMTGWILALKHTTHAGVAAFITATGNLMIPLVGVVLFGWSFSKRLGRSLLLAFAGLSLLFLDAGLSLDPSHLLFLVSAFLWAISVALMRNANPALGTATITAFQLVLSGLLILAASFAFEEPPRALPSVETCGWFLASVLLSTCLRFVLQYQGQRVSPPTRASMLMSFEPAWTMVLSMAFLGVSISPMQALGCAVIFAAVVLDLRLRDGDARP